VLDNKLPAHLPKADFVARYSVPGHVQPHVDYITPGVLLMGAARKPTEDKALDKRMFGITGNHRLPPILKAIPGILSSILQKAISTRCAMVVTPDCIRGEADDTHTLIPR